MTKATKPKTPSLEERLELLLEQNAQMALKLEALEKSKEVAKPMVTHTDAHTPKKGHKFVKTRILDEDGDLVWGLIEVTKDDKRPAFDPATNSLKSSSGVVKGNPMAGTKLGPNDIQVTGL